MKTKWIVILSIFLVIIFGAIILIVVFNNNTNLSPDEIQKQLTNCKLLEYNGKDKTNIVFFSDAKNSREYTDYLLNQEPYASNKKQLNFYYINDYTPKCEIYKGIAILCYSKELIKKISSCPADLIVVLKDEKPEIRSSAYMNVLSLNLNSPKTVFLHELGHAFANLADEYIPSKMPSKAKNCQKSCDNFQGLNEGCFNGCSNEGYSRSIENGIMRTLNTAEYGEFDKALILEKLKKSSDSKITSFAIKNIINCSEQQYVLIEGNYSKGKITINNKNIETGCLGTNGIGDFEYKLNLKSGEELTENFNPELIFTDTQKIEQQQINGEALEYQGDFFLKIPLIENSRSLEIIKNKEILTELNLEDIDSRPCKV